MIFISYRRSDGKATAQLLQKDLIERGFSKSDVFLDLHDVLGEDFTERCKKAISSSNVFLLLITKDSFIKKEPRDYYYDEIHQALNENKTIIPILYDAVFNEEVVPNEFKRDRLHQKNAIRYDLEYHENSVDKIVRAITKDRREPILAKIASLFAVPLVFITIYLGVSCIGGIVRYVWDNHWLSDKTCGEIASQRIVRDKNNPNIYYYITKDSLYVYDKDNKGIDVIGMLSVPETKGMQINVEWQSMKDAGFWTMAVAMVYEITKVRYKPHGSGKQMGVMIAATISVIAGFGFGFVIERMLFPVSESKLIKEKLHNQEWWSILVNTRETLPTIQRNF